MTGTAPTRPAPVPFQSTQPYWDAARRGELLLQRCDKGHLQFYPRPHCHICGSVTLAAQPSSGSGHVHTFSVVHRAAHEGFSSRVPYVFAIVELDEGITVSANVLDCDPLSVTVGMPVRAVFHDQLEELTLPQFAPTEGVTE